MKITVLTENCAGGGFLAEHGLSYLIEQDGIHLLFDTGSTDVFLRNARLLEIDLQNYVDTIVLSHGHWDHGDGLSYIEGKTLITHPGVFIKRYHKGDSENLGISMSKKEVSQKFNLVLSDKPYHIKEEIIYLGEIPRINSFESQKTPFADENGKDDFVPDDSALAIIQNNELNIITGCSHSGICNICEHAVKVTGIKKINSVTGGFHLKNDDEQTKQTIQYFKNKDIRYIFPSHCTALAALSAFYNEFKVPQLLTGGIIII
ncbi:MAG: MBL fold metallo-hydrolase [Bacteroidales bacterium]|nr:MBL fold metallo-hydrolase [Bacteroidales bacterium]